MHNFKENVQEVAKTIFVKGRKTIVHDYLTASAGHDSSDTKQTEEMQEKSQYLVDILSLSTLTLPDTVLLKLQTDWFHDFQTNSSLSERAHDLAVPAVESRNPFAVLETVKFLSNVNDQLSTDEMDTNQRVSCASDFHLLPNVLETVAPVSPSE